MTVVTEVREPTLLILISLAEGPKHGYAILADVERITAGRVVLAAGTLYTALDRLSADGLMVESGAEVVNGRNRRYYALTEIGFVTLKDEITRLRSLASLASRRLRQ